MKRRKSARRWRQCVGETSGIGYSEDMKIARGYRRRTPRSAGTLVSLSTLAAIAGVGLLSASTAFGQVTLRVVSRTGLQLPGAASGVVQSTFGTPTMNIEGSVAYTAVLTGSGVTTQNNQAIVLAELISSTTVARTGAFPAGTVPPGVPAGLTFDLLGDPALGSTGFVAFPARVAGTGVASTNDAGIWSNRTGSLGLVAREGNQAPGLATGVVYGTIAPDRDIVTNDEGLVAFVSGLGGVGVTTADDSAIWSQGSGGLEALGREGSPAPTLDPSVLYEAFTPGITRVPSLNDSGTSAWVTNLRNTGSSSNNEALYSNRSGLPEIIVREGTQAPGLTAGTLIGSFGAIVQTRISMNATGRVAFLNTLTGTGVTATNSTTVWSDGGGSLSLVARENEPAPGYGNGERLGLLVDGPVLNNDGQVAFVASIRSATTTQTIGQAIYRGTPGALTALARSGDAAPGTPLGVTFSGFGVANVESIALANGGLLAFTGVLTGPGITSSNNVGLWAVEPSGQAQIVLREGDVIDVNPAPGITDSRTVSSFDVAFGAGENDGQRHALNAIGNLAIRVRFTDSSEAIVVASVSSPCLQTPLVAAARAVEGTRVVLTGVVEGAPESVRWREVISGVDTNLSDTGLLSGTSTDTLTIARVTPADNGRQFRFTATFPCGTVVSGPATLSVGSADDLTRDGPVDILWRNAASGVNVAWTSDGTPAENSVISGTVGLPAVSDPAWQLVATCDTNFDGNLDLLWRNSVTGDVSVWRMDGSAFVSALALPRVADANWEIRGTGDVNQDGIPDIIWRNRGTGSNVVWIMNAAFDGTSQVLPLPAVSDLYWQIEGVADFSLDGKPDLLWRNARTGATAIWYLDGANFAAATDVTPAQANLAARVLAIADFNGDGRPDIAWRDTLTGNNELWLMNNATRTAVVPMPAVADTFWRGMGQAPFKAGPDGDFNGDSSVDLFWRHATNGQNLVWLMNNASVATVVPLGPINNNDWTVQAVADVTRDNRTDIVWRNTATGQNVLWIMNGLTLTQSIDLPGVGDVNWFVGAVADVDGDEMNDLVWYNRSTRAVVVWYLTPSGTPFVKGVGTLPSLEAVTDRVRGTGDFDLDGRYDLVIRGSQVNSGGRGGTGANVEYWRMNGAARLSVVDLPPVNDFAWDVRAVSDFNRDGRPDLMWRNGTTGANVIWLMNGATIGQSVELPPVQDTAWSPVR